jgi:uncharacterized protein (DUF427 family)
MGAACPGLSLMRDPSLTRDPATTTGALVGETRGRVRTEPGQKRIRAYLGGRPVVDTTRPLLVWESPRYPTYYVPVDDVLAHLEPTGTSERSPSRGTADVHDVRVEGTVAPGAALTYPEPELEALRGHVRLAWDAMDAWFEEDEEVFFHARDPYTRIDALRSTRHVRVELDGEVLAESDAPVLLFETGHPPRAYLPATDVRRELLVRSERVTHCPYKGSTEYFHVRLGDREERDLAWTYPAPFRESATIAGMVCFPSERVDVLVGGEPLQRA